MVRNKLKLESNKLILYGLVVIVIYALIMIFNKNNKCEMPRQINMENVRRIIWNRKNWVYTCMIVVLIVMIISTRQKGIREGFNGGEREGELDVILENNYKGWREGGMKIDLTVLFQFIEYYMVNDMDPRYKPSAELCEIGGETIRIKNAILDMLKMLYYIINVNDKDNFYYRYLVTRVGSNLERYMEEPRRKNYDEMVRGKIAKKVTIGKKNELDDYWPRANMDSEHQYPLPKNINVHNYYTYENMEVNLLALKMLIDAINTGDKGALGNIVNPTEHMALEEEFIVPLRIIIKSIKMIVDTDKYRDYVHGQKFSPRYSGLVFNPNMIKI